MAYKYKIVPFIGQVKTGIFSKEGPHTASEQLQDIIDSFVEDGWELQSISPVHILMKPGCLGSLFGQTASTIVFDQLVFKRDT